MKLFIGLLLSLSFFSGKAQSTFQDSLKQQLVKDWERAKAYTREYLEAMPADKYGFRPVDSMRSFSQQMLHLAQANVYFTSIISGTKYSLGTQNLEKSPTAQTKDSVEYYVDASYDFAITALKNMNAATLGEMITQNSPAGKRSETRLTWWLKAFEHQTHHRAQCTVYIRLVGLRPPAEKLF